MLTLVYIVIAAGFPLVALLARQRSARTMWLTTGGAIVAMLGLALVLASEWAGNRLAATEGYFNVAFGIVRMELFTFALPVGLAAAAVAALRERRTAWFAYPVALAVLLAGLFVGVNLLFWLSY